MQEARTPAGADAPGFDEGRISGYLARIGIDEAVAPTAEWLERLQLAHLLAVTFENLDIHLDRPIDLDLDSRYEKVVTRQRGGFCYELNGMFAALLAGIGFRATLVSSRVWMPDGSLSPPLDHATLLVDLDGTWLVDVGFGDAFTVPHRLGEEWVEQSRRFRTIPIDGGWRLEADEGQGWVGVYDADPTPRRLEEFADRCRYHQTDPRSFFRQLPFVSQATPTGRVTILGDSIIVNVDGTRTERDVAELGGITQAATGRFHDPIVEQLAQLDRVRS